MELIKAHALMLGIDVDSKAVSTRQEMWPALNDGDEIDYLYLCTHANRDGLAIGNETMTWQEFAKLACVSESLKPESTLLLACCRGGLNRVSYDMFISCPMIDYICGPTSEAYPTDLTTAFIVFLTQLERKGADQNYAAQKASNAIDRTFICFDRNVVEGQSDYQLRREEIEQEDELLNIEVLDRSPLG